MASLTHCMGGAMSKLSFESGADFMALTDARLRVGPASPVSAAVLALLTPHCGTCGPTGRRRLYPHCGASRGARPAPGVLSRIECDMFGSIGKWTAEITVPERRRDNAAFAAGSYDGRSRSCRHRFARRRADCGMHR